MLTFRMSEFLRYCAQIPCNSAAPDLPEAYSNYNTWGLNCEGFADLVLQNVSDARKISGFYGGGAVHVAAIMVTGNKQSFYYVDPYLRMVELLAIKPNEKTRVKTYYDDIVLQGSLNNTNLTVECIKGFRTILSYNFDIKSSLMDVNPHGYGFSILEKGRSITIEKKKTLDSTTEVNVYGADVRTFNQIINRRYGIGVDDVAKMFFDAGQNSLYSRSQSHW